MNRKMTAGNPIKIIIYFAFPLMIGSLFQQFYNITDSVIVGRFVNTDALAAVGVTGPISSLLIGFAMGLTSGFAIPVAEAFGAGDREKVRKYFGNSVILTAIIAAIITAVSIVSLSPLLKLIDTPENIFNDAKIYALIVYSSTFFMMFYNIFSSMMRALGDSRSPLYFLIISAIINIILDLLFVVVFRLAVIGVAVATSASHIISAVLCLLYILKRHPELIPQKKDWNISAKVTKKLLSMGIPMALQLSITAIGSMILQGAVNGFGSDAVAAVTVSSKVENIVNIPLSGIGVALSTFAAQNRGAKLYDRILKGTKQSFGINAVLSLGATGIMYFFGKAICTLFVNSVESPVLNYAEQYLKTISVFYFTLSVLFVFRSVLQGLGYGYTSVIAGASELVGRFLVAYLLSSILGFYAICFAGPIAWILADIPLVIIYLVKKRKLKKCNNI